MKFFILILSLCPLRSLLAMDPDLNILPGINAEKIYPPKSTFKNQNPYARFDSQVSLHFDFIQVSNLNAIYKDQASTVPSARYEVRTLYTTDLPIEFGFSLNYQSAYLINNSENIKLSILSMGPLFKYKCYSEDDVDIHFLVGAEISPLYQDISSQYTDSYSAVIFDLGLESEWNGPLGTIQFGSHLRHHNIALSNTNRPNVDLAPQEFSLNSLGIMIGYKIIWDL